jgi:hypothetical protein
MKLTRRMFPPKRHLIQLRPSFAHKIRDRKHPVGFLAAILGTLRRDRRKFTGYRSCQHSLREKATSIDSSRQYNYDGIRIAVLVSSRGMPEPSPHKLFYVFQAF